MAAAAAWGSGVSHTVRHLLFAVPGASRVVAGPHARRAIPEKKRKKKQNKQRRRRNEQMDLRDSLGWDVTPSQ
jgi:hypothetical protein